MADAPRGLDFHMRVATLPQGVSPQKTGAIGSSGPGGLGAEAGCKPVSSAAAKVSGDCGRLLFGYPALIWAISWQSDTSNGDMRTQARGARCKCGASHLAVQTGTEKHSEPNSIANYVTLVGAFCVKIVCLFKPQVP